MFQAQMQCIIIFTVPCITHYYSLYFFKNWWPEIFHVKVVDLIMSRTTSYIKYKCFVQWDTYENIDNIRFQLVIAVILSQHKPKLNLFHDVQFRYPAQHIIKICLTVLATKHRQTSPFYCVFIVWEGALKPHFSPSDMTL